MREPLDNLLRCRPWPHEPGREPSAAGRPTHCAHPAASKAWCNCPW